MKFVDDQTIAASINLKKSLLADQCTRPCILRFHEITEHIIRPEENLLQAEITRLDYFTCGNKFLINEPKSLVMLINFSKKYDFLPENTVNEIDFCSEVPSSNSHQNFHGMKILLNYAET